jgi:nucleoside-diphosphate-sugar epimerase
LRRSTGNPATRRAECFDTNLPGARHVCEYAEQTGCPNILFTSSIATYGPTPRATSESSPLHPVSAYGISKLSAELIHEIWQRAGAGRRLLCVPSGCDLRPRRSGQHPAHDPRGEPGLLPLPASKRLRKSYGYIEGLLDSFEFVMARPESRLAYNYVERETLELGELVAAVKAEFGKSGADAHHPAAAAGRCRVRRAGADRRAQLHPPGPGAQGGDLHAHRAGISDQLRVRIPL